MQCKAATYKLICFISTGVFIFIFLIQASAQQKKIDSLKELIAHAIHDTDKIELYWRLGHAYYFEKKMDSSVASFEYSIKLNRETNYSPLLLCWNLGALDYRLYETGNYTQSLNYATQHLEQSEAINDTSQQGFAHLVFGHNYKALGYYKDALRHYFEARRIFKLYWETRTGKEDNTYTFLCIAETYLKMSKPDSAMLFATRAYRIGLNESKGEYILLSERILGDITLAKGNDSAALRYYRSYIPDYKKYNETNRDLGFVLNSMSGIFQKKGQLDSSVFYAKKALENARLYQDQQNLYTASHFLAEYYNGKDNSAAYEYLKIAVITKDNMSNSEKLKLAQVLLFNEQVKQKEKAEQEAKDAARLKLIIIISSVVVLLIVFLVWNRLWQLRLRYRAILKQKEAEKLKAEYEKKMIELEAKALRAQMNPHFIFNCMNSIKSLIQKNEEEKAINYLTTFSKLIRTIFQNSDKREISLYEEIETCRLYAALENMRLGNKFKYKFQVGEGIDLKSVLIPPLIIQPFIENAIWHGIMPKETGGILNVIVEKDSTFIKCIIDDNGIGRQTSNDNKFTNNESSHQSKGIHLTRARLNLNNLINERSGNVEIIDKKDVNQKATGTTVILYFEE